jgi:hypothetical protein
MFAKCASIVGLAAVTATTLASAQTPIEKARLARTAWSAFQCATYAEMSGDKKEQARLFDVAFKAARDFIEAAKIGQIPAEVARSQVPIGVSMLLQGPSTDFIVGRIFENSTRDAYDDVVKKENGLPLDNSEWVRDDALRISKAKNLYHRSNCVLLE